MAYNIEWDKTGERTYETGVTMCALYVADSTGAYGDGVAWNGVTAFTESPSGAEATDLYADDNKYLSLYSAEELGASIEAYTYPDEFKACDGSANLGGVAGINVGQQSRSMFGIAYVTTEGNDSVGNDYNKKLHLVYGCKASPSERAYSSINDSPEAITFSWELTTQKADSIDALGKTSLITIDKNDLEATYPEGANGTGWDVILNYVYGTPYTYEAHSDLSTFVDGTVYYTDQNGTVKSSSVATPVSGTTYYTRTGARGQLPTPKEILALLGVTIGTTSYSSYLPSGATAYTAPVAAG